MPSAKQPVGAASAASPTDRSEASWAKAVHRTTRRCSRRGADLKSLQDGLCVINVRPAAERRCWTDCSRLMRKGLTPLLALVLVTTCCGPPPAPQETPKASSPPPTLRAGEDPARERTALSLYGGKFLLPPSCTLECVLAVDAHHGTLHCSDVPVSISYFGALSFVISRDLEPNSPGVEGSRRVNDAHLYWGRTGSEYCAVATYPVPLEEAEDASVNHQFCVASGNEAAHQRVRAIVETFQQVPLDEPRTECPFDG